MSMRNRCSRSVAILGMAASVVLGSVSLGSSSDLERYRAFGRPDAVGQTAAAPAPGKPSPLATFHEHIRPYLSTGGYGRLFGHGKVVGGGAPRAFAPTPGGNVVVNDPTGQTCGAGCTQSEESIAVSGSDVVIGYNDSEGFVDPTQGISGYSYSSNGGASWTDGGGLPLAGGGDALFGDPALVSCGGAFYYASLYTTGCLSTPSGTTVGESEPNDTAAGADAAALGDDYTGGISPASDADYVSFFAPAGTNLSATIVLGTLSDSTLELFAPDGTTSLAFNDDSVGLASQINYAITSAGTYYLAVRSYAAFYTGT